MRNDYKNIPDGLLALTLLSFNAIILIGVDNYPHWQFWASLGSFLGFAIMSFEEYRLSKKIKNKPVITKFIPDGMAIVTIVSFNVFIHRLFVSFLKWQFWFSLVGFLGFAIMTFVVYRFNRNKISK